MTDTRIRALDGLRAIAVLLVLVHHTADLDYTALGDFQEWNPGQVGVRLFFVLSGFLITGILLSARESDDRWYAWRAFYARRALRIFPLAYAVLLTCWLIGLPAMQHHPWWYLTYASNWQPIAGIVQEPGLNHFWSLAVEEQFYIVWPALILWVPSRWLPLSIGVAIVLAGLSRVWLTVWFGPVAGYTATIARMDALAWGAWLAYSRVTIRRQLLGGIALLGLALVLPPSRLLVSEWAAILVSGSVVIGTLQAPPIIRRVLTLTPLVWIGTVSYGVYVFHHLIPEVTRLIETRYDIWLRLPAYGPWRFLVIGALSIGLASLSWVVVERPLNDLKRFLPYRVNPREPRGQ